MWNKEYVFVREFGQGACGRTVLLMDPAIKEQIVCKKYTPYSEEEREELYDGFVRRDSSASQALSSKYSPNIQLYYPTKEFRGLHFHGVC